MNWKKYYSLEKLIKAGRKAAEHCDVVSFDLFDTLFIRRIHDPDLIKLPVSRYISCLASQSGIEILPDRVQELRDAIEKEQRIETGKTFADQEACYPVFMRRLLLEVFEDQYTDTILSDVTAYELEMESAMLVPRQALIDWMAELFESGKRIFIISDIYLPADHLKKLVERAGFLNYCEDLVSSADSFLAKASGKGFELVRKQFNLDQNSWLHIGDNPHSDGMRAAEFGLVALVLHDGEEKYRKGLMRRYFEYGERGRSFYRGRALQQLMLPLEAENIDRSELYREGYNFLGPLFGGFVQHIADESRRLGLNKIFFLSREGYTFKKIWEKITPSLYPDKNLPEIEYLYVSRMALAATSCAYDGLTRGNVTIAFLPAGNRDFHDIARVYQLDIDGLKPHLERFKLRVDTPLTPRYEGFSREINIHFMKLLNDELFQDEIRRQCLPKNEALMRYLDDVGFFRHQQVAIVDIGWLGTIQEYLYNAVKHRTDCPRFHGYLFGATRGVGYPTTLKKQTEGVLYDRHRFDFAASSVLYARDLFEEACRAPHPTLDGYELTTDGYRLRFRHDDEISRAEQEQDAYFAPLQQGIFDSAEKYGQASALLGYKLFDYRPWFNYLLTAKLAFPKSSEVMTIRHKHHLDDFNGVHRTTIKKAREQKQLWSSSCWNLRLNPFLRLRYFWRHIKDVLRN